MKHFLHLITIILPFTAFAQTPLPIHKKTGHVVFSDVVDTKGISQAELHSRMKAFASTYSAAANGMEIEDESASRIAGKAFADIIVNDGTTTEKQRLSYTLLIEMGDGKFSYELKDFSMQRYCIPARPIACEVQTKPVAVEAVLTYGKKPNRKSGPVTPYSVESELNKAASNLITAMKSSAATERQIAGIKPN